MGTMLEVTRAALDALIGEAAGAAPLECCGLLLGRDGRVTQIRPAANVHPDPQRHFEIDPALLIAAHREERAGGPELIGYYHSHPAGHPRPSATDCEHSSGDGRVWAIVASGEVTFWRDGESGFEALSMRAIDG